jgi:Telomere recombination
MARYFDIHPASPQRRAIDAIADIVRAGSVIAYPTDSCYALGCKLGNGDGFTRIRSIRQLDPQPTGINVRGAAPNGGYSRILLELPITQCDAIWLSLMPIADSTRARPALARRLAARQV